MLTVVHDSSVLPTFASPFLGADRPMARKPDRERSFRKARTAGRPVPPVAGFRGFQRKARFSTTCQETNAQKQHLRYHHKQLKPDGLAAREPESGHLLHGPSPDAGH